MSDSNPEYPKRTTHFAHKFVRLLSNSDAARELGPEACWLASAIAHYEDFLRYTKPVSFHNTHLFLYCGFRNEKALIRARQKAVELGWLHYDKGAKRKPARYWAEIPPEVIDLFDSSPEHYDDVFSGENDRENGGKTGALLPCSLTPTPTPTLKKRESRLAPPPNCWH